MASYVTMKQVTSLISLLCLEMQSTNDMISWRCSYFVTLPFLSGRCSAAAVDALTSGLWGSWCLSDVRWRWGTNHQPGRRRYYETILAEKASTVTSTSAFSHLFLVPFEIREENKANLRVGIFINNPVSFCLLLQDVVHPLTGWQIR